MTTQFNDLRKRKKYWETWYLRSSWIYISSCWKMFVVQTVCFILVLGKSSVLTQWLPQRVSVPVALNLGSIAWQYHQFLWAQLFPLFPIAKLRGCNNDVLWLHMYICSWISQVWFRMFCWPLDLPNQNCSFNSLMILVSSVLGGKPSQKSSSE